MDTACVGFLGAVQCNLITDAYLDSIYNLSLDGVIGYRGHNRFGEPFDNQVESLWEYLCLHKTRDYYAAGSASNFVLNTGQYKPFPDMDYETLITRSDVYLGATRYYKDSGGLTHNCWYNDKYPNTVIFQSTIDSIWYKLEERYKESNWNLDMDEFSWYNLVLATLAHELGHSFGRDGEHRPLSPTDACVMIGKYPSFNGIGTQLEADFKLKRYLFWLCMCPNCRQRLCGVDNFKV